MLQFIHYPRCTTCKKAQKWLDENGIKYEALHIVEQTPTKEQLKSLWEKVDFHLRNFLIHLV